MRGRVRVDWFGVGLVVASAINGIWIALTMPPLNLNVSIICLFVHFFTLGVILGVEVITGDRDGNNR